MKACFFITGTDTEIGKTFCTVNLIHSFRNEGFSVAAMKPVAAGGYWDNGQLRNDDVEQLITATGLTLPHADVNPYLFEPPIAPHLAAVQLGQSIELIKIIEVYQRMINYADILLIEGVGGWRVPLNATQDMADIVHATHAQVVVVVGLRLGCINHALLTVEAILRDYCTIVGWIANTIDPNFSTTEVINTLKERINAPLLAIVPFMATQDSYFLFTSDILRQLLNDHTT